MHSNNAQTRYLLVGITLALVAWGVFHAFGALSYNGNPWRAVMVLACCGSFIGFWWLMLAQRRRRMSGRRQP